MGILKNALRERIRRKDIYVVIALGLLIVLLCMSGTVGLEVAGVPVTSVEGMVPILLNVIAVLGGGIAVALSLRTIPNEYERRTSHLVWIRGISQWKYHMQLAAANVISSVAALLILYISVIIFAAMKGDGQIVLRSIPAFVLFAIGTAGVSLFTSALSLILPSMAAGVLGALVMLAGTMYPVLDTLHTLLTGTAEKLLEIFLFLIPNLYKITAQAKAFLFQEEMDAHPIIGGLLFCYVGYLILFVCRRKEA